MEIEICMKFYLTGWNFYKILFGKNVTYWIHTLLPFYLFIYMYIFFCHVIKVNCPITSDVYRSIA